MQVFPQQFFPLKQSFLNPVLFILAHPAVIMDSYTLPILSPTPAILNGLPNGGPVRQGRDMYRLALEDQYAQGTNAVNVPKWVNRIQRRRRPLPGRF